jgi:hypothetical protein
MLWITWLGPTQTMRKKKNPGASAGLCFIDATIAAAVCSGLE